MFRSQISYNMDRCSKQRWEELEESQKKKDQKRERKKKEDQCARKGRKVAKHPQCCWGSGGSESKLAESGGCGAIWRDERSKLRAAVGEAHVEVRKQKTPHIRTFGSCDVEKMRACTPLWREGAKHISKTKCKKKTQRSDHFWKLRVVARRTCRSQNDKTPCQDHFWNSIVIFWWQAQQNVKVLWQLLKQWQAWG